MSSTAVQYSVRESAKAKNLRLKVSIQRGLEVIVPFGFDRSHIQPILDKKRRWIQKAERRVHEHRKFFRPPPPDELPDHILLRAIGETWRVAYRHSKTRWAAAYELGDDTLLVRGNIASKPACKAALRRWLARRCHENVVPWLREASLENTLPFSNAMVKIQKTRWASCSRHKTISLNAKLLFLSPDLVRYVFIHELCHTIHMNHSAKFWALLAEVYPNFRPLDDKLRNAWQTVPHWASADKGQYGI